MKTPTDFKQETTRFKQRVNAFKAAFQGLRTGWLECIHFRFHLLAFAAVIIAGYFLNVSIIEWCILLACSGMVLLAELLNTAIEKLADRVNLNYDPLIGKVKDLGAAAVLVAAIISLIIGGIIFLPKLI